MKYKLLLFLISFFTSIIANSQSNSVEMADTMRKEGKIYVVIAVILTIFAGIILYLVRLDRKISRLEKQSL
jgi:nitrate reductase gamma subunit